mmetsp:Transcript_35238/g.108321  ORF Transcript_35238/g.108321 Transcript_35238/m.108321 type:complete len:214 (-) Transcript_35238:54-695(-)
MHNQTNHNQRHRQHRQRRQQQQLQEPSVRPRLGRWGSPKMPAAPCRGQPRACPLAAPPQTRSCRSTRRSFPAMAPAFFTAVTRAPCSFPSSLLSLSLASALAPVLAPLLATESRLATLLKQSAHQLSQLSPSAFLFSAPSPFFSSRLLAWMQSVRPLPSRPRPWPSCQPYFIRIRLPKSDSNALLQLTPLLAAMRSWYFLDIFRNGRAATHAV